MAYQIATARVRLLFHFLRPGRIPRPYFHRKQRPMAGQPSVRRARARFLHRPRRRKSDQLDQAAGQQPAFPDVLPFQSHPRSHTTTRHAWNTFMTESPSPNRRTSSTGDRKRTGVLSKGKRSKNWDIAGELLPKTRTSGGAAIPDYLSTPTECNGPPPGVQFIKN